MIISSIELFTLFDSTAEGKIQGTRDERSRNHQTANPDEPMSAVSTYETHTHVMMGGSWIIMRRMEEPIGKNSSTISSTLKESTCRMRTVGEVRHHDM